MTRTEAEPGDVTETPKGLPNYTGAHVDAEAAADAIAEKYNLITESSAGRVVIYAGGTVGHWVIDDLEDLGFRVNAANLDQDALYFKAMRE